MKPCEHFLKFAEEFYRPLNSNPKKGFLDLESSKLYPVRTVHHPVEIFAKFNIK